MDLQQLKLLQHNFDWGIIYMTICKRVIVWTDTELK
jgi:hypothetical protein